jgi:hypothetical protein
VAEWERERKKLDQERQRLYEAMTVVSNLSDTRARLALKEEERTHKQNQLAKL